MIRLIARVKARGVRQPALVRPDPEGGYEIIDGHRRYRASELAERPDMPVIIRDLSDEEPARDRNRWDPYNCLGGNPLP